MRLISWNVNGIRSVVAKGFLDALSRLRADILCLQETKAAEDQLGHIDWPKRYHRIWYSAEKRGYSGTVIFTKEKPLEVSFGLGKRSLDREGRVLTAEFADFYLVNVYTPNAQRELTRLAYRVESWDPAFRRYVRRLARTKPVVFCGDLNVAHQEIDLANPKTNVKNAGFTPEERTSFSKLLKAGFVDSFREFESAGGHYSWWSYRNDARARNIGWRIDYVGLSPELRPRLKRAFIRPEIHGSDHCPVGIELS